MINRNLIDRESSTWVQKNIISKEQKERIMELYPAPEVAKKKKSSINIVYILAGMAGLLFSLGIILFYAANWPGMSPTSKVVQIFLLILALYGISFYQLAIRRTHINIGRIFLILGMVAYGAGIMLVAQIFHISAHPTNGVLAWALGALIMAMVVREKWGYYLAMGLFFIWNSWEVSLFNNPNYAFVLVPLLLGFLFYREKDRVGIFFPFFFLVISFYQVNSHWFDIMSAFSIDYARIFMTILHMIVGVNLVALAWILDKDRVFSGLKHLMSVVGWVFILIPFLFISWPFNIDSTVLPLSQFPVTIIVETVFFITLCGVILFFLYKRKESVVLLSGILGFSILLLALPLGHNTTRMVSTHLGMVLFMGAFLYSAYGVFKDKPVERGMAFVSFITLMIVKFLGFLIIGVVDSKFTVAYFTGFVVFLVVCFLINHIVSYSLENKGIGFPTTVIDSVSGFLLFFIIYGLSFEVEAQKSIFDAKAIVLIMLFMFITLALILYSYLWPKVKDKLMLVLSGIVLLSSMLVLLVSRPSMDWVFYSVVFNLLLFLITGVFIFYSVKKHSKKVLNFAIIGFILHIITRYFDLFWDMFSGSLLFIVTSLLLFLGAWIIERNRRKLLKVINES